MIFRASESPLGRSPQPSSTTSSNETFCTGLSRPDLLRFEHRTCCVKHDAWSPREAALRTIRQPILRPSGAVRRAEPLRYDVANLHANTLSPSHPAGTPAGEVVFSVIENSLRAKIKCRRPVACRAAKRRNGPKRISRPGWGGACRDIYGVGGEGSQLCPTGRRYEVEANDALIQPRSLAFQRKAPVGPSQYTTPHSVPLARRSRVLSR